MVTPNQRQENDPHFPKLHNLKLLSQLYPMKRRVFLVEDEASLQKAIRLNLEMDDCEVVAVDNGLAAVSQYKSGSYDLVILDVMLPGLSGFDVCENIRSKDKDVPVLFLTAKGSGEDKVHGLRLGADDYLTKPFHLEEFLLRVQNLMRRSKRIPESSTGSEYTFGKNYVNFVTYEARGWNGETVSLSKREVELLRLLIDKKDEVVSRDLILDLLWKEDALPTARTIDNYILNFRKYFEENPREPVHFHSIRGVGYKFKND